MTLTAWLSIAAICLTGAMSPGPSLAVVVRNTVQGGRRDGVLTGVGHGLGVGIYAFGAVVGLAALITATPGAARAVEAVGGAVLVWMGIQTLRHAGEGGLEHETSGRRGFSEGFAVAFLNPKIAVFFLALLGSVVPAEASTADRAGVAGVAMLIDAGWYVFAAVALATSGAAGWLASKGVWIDRTLGVLLVGLGTWMAVAATAGG